MLNILDDIKSIIDRWNQEKGGNDLDKLQDIRDELAHALWQIHDDIATMRGEAERMDSVVKIERDKAKLKIMKENEGMRGVVAYADSQSLIDCEELLMDKHKSETFYYKIRYAHDAAGMVYNSIASKVDILKRRIDKRA